VIVQRLSAAYPDARCALNYRNPLQLLIATILSAQCTDERVNIVTRSLFAKYRTASDYANVNPAELEQDIRSTGFFRNKARSIRECCRLLVERHGGEVPRTMDELVQLPGIGRKTANVVLGTAMGLPTGVVVDTHVHRLSRRMGLTRQREPEKIERVLMRLIPQQEWIGFGHRMIAHGRRLCTARKPECASCCVCDVCPKIGVSK
jgi:endonuclease-3